MEQQPKLVLAQLPILVQVQLEEFLRDPATARQSAVSESRDRAGVHGVVMMTMMTIMMVMMVIMMVIMVVR